MDSRRFQQFFCLCSQRFSMTVSSSFVQCTTVIISALVSVVVPPPTLWALWHLQYVLCFNCFKTTPHLSMYPEILQCVFDVMLKTNKLHVSPKKKTVSRVEGDTRVTSSLWLILYSSIQPFRFQREKFFFFCFVLFFSLKRFWRHSGLYLWFFFNCMSKKGVCFIYSSFFFLFHFLLM